MQRTFLSASPEQTRQWARTLTHHLHPPLIIALRGDLGAGKTLFTQALAAALGVTAVVTSPTFTLINEYDLPDGNTLYHVDCYRLGDAVAEAHMLGLEELFDLGFVVIEWADRIDSFLPPQRIDITFSDAGPQQRRICVLDTRPAAHDPLPVLHQECRR